MQETARDKQEETETNRDKQTQTEINGLQIKKAATFKNLIHITLFNDFFGKIELDSQRQTDADRDRQRETHTNRDKQAHRNTPKII